ncbi:MAG: serine/threonine protein phosphatase [Novosphingobium sp.]|nr:serine/threonine protein phosphatase [Novosphingobium sp.]
MIEKFRQFFRPKPVELPVVPTGERIYAIGDIHGRLDLFVAMARAIEEDDERRGSAETTIVLLGDLIDRGPDSREVLNGARAWRDYRRVRIIAGNHEEMFLKSFHKIETFAHFLRYGGYETVLSFGVDPERFRQADLGDAQQMMIDAVPEADIAFIESFEDSIVVGDYLFVHAGVHPGEPLEEQHIHNMRWIREPFLSHSGSFGHFVVHGHTIADDVTIRHNRIGLDTGAFMSGKLTAIGLEGQDKWLIETCDVDGVVTTSSTPI